MNVKDEVNLNISGTAFAAEQSASSEVDKGKSLLMARIDFKNRSISGKMFDAIAGLFRQQFLMQEKPSRADVIKTTAQLIPRI